MNPQDPNTPAPGNSNNPETPAPAPTPTPAPTPDVVPPAAPVDNSQLAASPEPVIETSTSGVTPVKRGNKKFTILLVVILLVIIGSGVALLLGR